MVGSARLGIHRNPSASFPAWASRYSAWYNPIQIGNWISVGRHPPRGLTPASLYNSIWRLASSSLLSLYFFCSSWSFGWSSCTALEDLICFALSGAVSNLMSSVKMMMANPKLYGMPSPDKTELMPSSAAMIGTMIISI